jgi:hypothetical protein
VTQRDWRAWHEPYDDPTSAISQRLAVVQKRLVEAIDAAPAGPVRVISMCAGQGRDVLGVLRHHARSGDVRARLVELDAAIAAQARATAAPFAGVKVVTGDAGSTSAYEGAVPAHVILACGIFGNIADAEIWRTIERLPTLCAPGAVVIWTRHRIAPDLTPTVRGWFAEAGFEEVAFDSAADQAYGVGTHRLVRPPEPFQAGSTLFAF